MHKRTACISRYILYLCCELPICTMSEQEDIVPRTVIVDETLAEVQGYVGNGSNKIHPPIFRLSRWTIRK